jgi:hypothetical protein
MVGKKQLKHLSTLGYSRLLVDADNRQLYCYRTAFNCYDTVFGIVTALL